MATVRPCGGSGRRSNNNDDTGPIGARFKMINTQNHNAIEAEALGSGKYLR